MKNFTIDTNRNLFDSFNRPVGLLEHNNRISYKHGFESTHKLGSANLIRDGYNRIVGSISQSGPLAGPGGASNTFEGRSANGFFAPNAIKPIATSAPLDVKLFSHP